MPKDVSDRLSAEDADRFAANFRPSWEPPAPAAIAAPAPTRPATADFAIRGDDDARLPRSRKGGILLTLGAVSGFVALGVLALLSGRHTPPPSWEGSAPRAAKKPEPAPAPTPAAPPSTPPVEPVVAEPVAPATPAVETAMLPTLPLEAVDPAAMPGPVIPAEAVVDPATVATPAIGPVAPPVEPAAPAATASLPPAVVPPAPVAPAAQPHVEPPKPEPEPPPAAPKMVKVRISATPAEAELSLDGQSIPNPFEADVIISGKHRVQAKAPGHRSADVTVPFDQPQELALRLERLEPAKARAARRTRSAPTPQKPARAHRGAGFVSESPY